MSKLYLLGDIGYYNKNLKRILKSIKENIDNDDVIIVLGDNFYPIGIKDENDIQIDKFKELFSIFKNKIYLILGNHDYILKPSAQINNKNWIMPNWYYRVDINEYSLYFLDTIQLYPSEHVDGQRVKDTHNKPLLKIFEQQLNWLENELISSNKKHKLVFGHYPIITNGVYYYDFHKLYNRLIPLFEKYNVKAYFSGHEHNNQYINRRIGKYDFNQFICGSTAEVRNDDKKENKNNEVDMFDNLNCCYIIVSEENNNLNVTFNNKENKLFEYNI